MTVARNNGRPNFAYASFGPVMNTLRCSNSDAAKSSTSNTNSVLTYAYAKRAINAGSPYLGRPTVCRQQELWAAQFCPASSGMPRPKTCSQDRFHTPMKRGLAHACCAPFHGSPRKRLPHPRVFCKGGYHEPILWLHFVRAQSSRAGKGCKPSARSRGPHPSNSATDGAASSVVVQRKNKCKAGPAPTANRTSITARIGRP